MTPRQYAAIVLGVVVVIGVVAALWVWLFKDDNDI